MQSTIFRFILKFSRREQILLLIFTALSFPFLYMSLDLPKTIINQAIGGQDFPRTVLGYEFEQIPFLLLLCSLFLSLVLVNGGFKYFINVYRGVVGERMLRRLRYQLFARMLRFPQPQFRKTSQGEMVSMITAETELLGGFIGDSIALPAFQGGTLLTIITFMMIQDWVLGLAAIFLYPVQAYLIPKLQRRVNQLRKQRTLKVRKLSERIGEVVVGIREVHANDTSQYELADFSERAGEIYQLRYKAYVMKFLIKFINNFLAQITPFFFYSIGGYLVIKGELSFGALVAVLAAYKDMSDPWKELLNYYQNMEDCRVKYELLAETFQPPGMLPENMLSADVVDDRPLLGELVAANVDLSEEDEVEGLFAGNLSMRLPLPQSVALVGEHGSGRERFASVITGIFRPRAGSVSINDVDVTQAPEAVTGRRTSYVGQQPSLRSGSLKDNLYYCLMHRPVTPKEYDEEEGKEIERKRHEAQLSGNSDADLAADWIDYQAIGVGDPDGLVERTLQVLNISGMSDDVYQFGLQATLDPQANPELAARVLEARHALKQRLEDPEIGSLVDQFDRDSYNDNLTVAENLMFGTPRDDSLQIDQLADNEYMRRVLEEARLTKPFLQIGRQIAEVMVDLFADVEADSHLFEQFSFISADDLPEFKSLLARTADSDLEQLEESDRRLLLSLPFKLIPARHRLGLVTEELKPRLLEARRIFCKGFEDGPPAVDFFDPENYSRSISIQDNILFGRLVYGMPRAQATIGALIEEVVAKLDLRRPITELGLDYPVGIGGTRLSPAQRQKLAIARSVLKKPDVLVLDEATAILDESAQKSLMGSLFEEFKGRALIWLVHRASLAEQFDSTVLMERGKCVAQGSYAELKEAIPG
ncbi:MAG: ATP-binding cassette domain-containing protein [Gammaproteobacteria bacterium]|nr:ATP-binding cassette domain-containing protein [Gammaproteobacteria bacterium]NIP90690.1 ATP-binding cassette domain-containing protein [Gammaproteobacteria bacterium]NIR25313.1 ATP-binding cassette domain-containing protein [Gammaproteobacteria bacterium]NIS07009.1 ATP-binding cassette domain-containing protein [Gammaproteobacteria bacterium]NIU41978.1 ATP-binding cassette domain-containing protein [Gammaproteobacteria bacterium]